MKNVLLISSLSFLLFLTFSCKNKITPTVKVENYPSVITPNTAYIQLDTIYDEVVNLRTRPLDKYSLFAVRKGSKWGVSNSYGGAYIAPKYDAFASNKNSLALKEDGVWRIMDNSYNTIDSGKMDDLIGYHDNLYISIMGGKKALVSERSVTDHIYTEITGPPDAAQYFYGEVDGVWNAYDFEGSIIKTQSTMQVAALKVLNEYQVTLYGYGPIKLGMTEDQVENVIGLKFIENGSTSDCRMMQFDSGFPQMHFLFDRKGGKRLLERIYIGESSIKTKSGIGKGSTEEEILNAYGGKMTKELHKYDSQAVYYYYLPVDKRDKQYRLNFDYSVKDDKVKHYSVGRDPAIFYVEGCF